VGEETATKPVRTRTPRRRPQAKPAEPASDAVVPAVDAAAEAVVDSTPERAPRRRTRRPSRSSKPDALGAPSVDAEAATDPVIQAALTAPAEVPAAAEPIVPVRQAPPVRRRVGGRRTASEAAGAIAQANAQLANSPTVSESPSAAVAPDTEEVPANAPNPRSRRRRGAKRPEAAVIISTGDEPAAADPESMLLDLNLDNEPVDDAGASDDERKRSRRSRRGGRRRSGRQSDGELGEETDAEVTAADIEEVDPDVPVFSTPAPAWKAPLLVPTAESLGLSPLRLRATAVLADDASGFEINGVYYGPELFFVNAETAANPEVVSEQIKLAASIGIHLHSGVAYLPLKNAFGVRSFSGIEALINQVLDSDPDGYIFIRLQCVPTNFWARTHPDEMSVYSDGSNGDVSFASQAFWQDTVEAIAALLEYLADPATRGGDRVVGIHLDKGEWFNDANAGYDYSAPNKLAYQNWLHERYQNPYALRAAWFSGTAQFETAEIPKWPGNPASRKKEDVVLYTKPRERRYIDFNAYTSDLMAQAITGVAQALKWLSNNQLLVGASYGYTFEFAARNDSGHQALTKVMQSRFVDVIAGPNSYATRQAGGAGAFSSPVDSAKLNGKLWIVEDDTKTFLAADETDDAFNPKVISSQDTISVLRRNASAAYVHGCGICWMDLWGNGWLNSPEIWAEIGELRSQGIISRRLRQQTDQVPDVAVLIDEAGYNHVCGDPSGVALQAGLITKSRELIYRSGASIGFYLQSDVALLPDSIKLYIFLNPLRVTTQERQVIREKLQKNGKTLAWLYAPGLFDERGDSPTEVSEIVGMPLKALPWNSHIGTIFTEERHPVTERLHGGKRLGSDEILNPSYAVADPTAIVLGEYAQSGLPSIAAKVNEGGWKSVFIGEPHLTGELLRGLYRYAGVHVYDVQDDIVHAGSSGVLLVHSPYTGQRTIHLPRMAAVYSLYERRLVTQSSSTFRAFMRGRSTNFFLWGDIERIAAALGSTPDLLREQHAAWKAERESSQQRNPRGQQQRDQAFADGDSEQEYGSGDDAENQEGEGEELDSEIVVEVIEVSSMPDAVSMLVESGLIAGDIDIAEGEFGIDTTDDDTEPVAETTPGKTEPMSPSRRRRWNRKRNMQAAKSASAPSISMEDLLSDLPPRKPNPPKTEES
jgi:hypothetical protein